jgi:hypothetical protein
MAVTDGIAAGTALGTIALAAAPLGGVFFLQPGATSAQQISALCSNERRGEDRHHEGSPERSHER